MSTSPISAAPPGRNGMLWQRLASVAGLIVTLALVGLGAVWPSLFSFFALVALPATVIFLVGIFRPAIITNRPRLRLYLWVCVALSIVSWIVEIAWLVTQYS
jgi:hypothetical protein